MTKKNIFHTDYTKKVTYGTGNITSKKVGGVLLRNLNITVLRLINIQPILRIFLVSYLIVKSLYKNMIFNTVKYTVISPAKYRLKRILITKLALLPIWSIKLLKILCQPISYILDGYVVKKVKRDHLVLLLMLLLVLMLIPWCQRSKVVLIGYKNPMYITTRGMKHAKKLVASKDTTEAVKKTLFPFSNAVKNEIIAKSENYVVSTTNKTAIETTTINSEKTLLKKTAANLTLSEERQKHIVQMNITYDLIKKHPKFVQDIIINHIYNGGSRVQDNISSWQMLVSRLFKEGKIKNEIDFTPYINDPNKFKLQLSAVLNKEPNLLDELMTLNSVSLAFPGVFLNDTQNPLIQDLKQQFPVVKLSGNAKPDALIFYKGVLYEYDVKRFGKLTKKLFKNDQIHTVGLKDAEKKLDLCTNVVIDTIRYKMKILAKEGQNISLEMQQFLIELKTLKEIKDINEKHLEYNTTIRKGWELVLELGLRPTFVGIVDIKDFNVSTEITKNYGILSFEEIAKKSSEIVRVMASKLKTPEKTQAQLEQEAVDLIEKNKYCTDLADTFKEMAFPEGGNFDE
jgi:hypothetical protein